MDEIFGKLAALAEVIPADCMNVAAATVARLQSLSGYSAVAQSMFGNTAEESAHTAFAREVLKTTMTPRELASAMRAAAAAAEQMRRQTSIQILWTGPKTSAVPVRNTEQALCDLVDKAKETLFIVSFVAFKADLVYTKIAEAVSRGVKVSLLTESSKKHGGKLDDDPIKLLRAKIAGATFYRWTAKTNTASGCVHAKCAIADRKAALITSANLTGAAMENNMELGLLVENDYIAGRLADLFAALTTEKIIEKA